MSEIEQVIRTTCPRDCYDTCGVAVHVLNGAIASVRGDPHHFVSHGQLCTKCSIGYNNEWIDPRVRLTHPLRRVGRKGEGRFEAVSWDAALNEIAGRLKRIVADAGPQAILNTHYSGTISLIGYLFPTRFFNRLGATEVSPDTICNMAGHVALHYVYGTSVSGFDPRTGDSAACILVWGANPSASGPHVQEHWIEKLPGKVVVIDPIRTPTAAAADIHLQPFPGSDAALAFSMLHVISREGLIDREFVANHTLGWEELEPMLEPCTAAWGEAQTGVPARLIEDTARLYARGPSLLWMGQALQRQPTGGNVMRACSILPAVTGNIGKPGAGFVYLNFDMAARGIDADYLTAPHLSKGAGSSISHMDLAERLEDPARAQALLCWNINIAASNPQQERLRRALEREDLTTIVLDLFRTDTTDFADFVLPAASFLEFDDIVASYFHLTLSAQVKAAQPPGEALPNSEIFRRLARAMDMTEPELHESDAEIIATLLKRAKFDGDFRAFAARSPVHVPAEPAIQFRDLAFPTPSGRIEIASASAAADGHPRVPQPLADPRPQSGRLRLLSPSSAWSLNDSFSNVAKIAAHVGPAVIAIHPEDAARRGLGEGDRVTVANETGRLVMRVTLSDAVPRGVALSHKGRWPKQEAGGRNVNVLNPGRKADMGESTSVHAVEVTIAPLTAA
ncbi:MAG TPA: molybdopterin-dependent oxidoreductase [Candidatus Binataceae bacterium]|nr:molybdopterin-dependent oxidoreductase [Candidatus Binataceae bacterium]